jgi:RNA polymerase primary sigma factor
MICIKKEVENNFDIKQGAYIKDLGKRKHISIEEQAECIRLYRETGEQKYFDKLIETNLLFIVSIARKLNHSNLTLSEKISSGVVGLMRAVDKFDINKGASFITYARWWIEQSIRKDLLASANLVRIPTGTYRKIRKIQKLTEEGWTNEEIKKHYNISNKKLSLFRASGHEVSLSTTLTDDGFTVQDTIGTDDENMKSQSNNEDYNFIMSKIDLLKPRTRKIVELRFGLTGEAPMTLQEISDKYSVSRERIRQIINKGIEQLREFCDINI